MIAELRSPLFVTTVSTKAALAGIGGIVESLRFFLASFLLHLFIEAFS